MWGVFCHNLGITTNTLENRFKSKFSFNNGNFFKIHDHFRTRENPRFNDVSQLINALSLYQIKIFLVWIVLISWTISSARRELPGG